jgi:nucleoside-diphosphate-sugar epimerase
MLERPLVTGAGGFIGSNLAFQLSNMPEVEFVYVVDLPGNPLITQFQDNPKFKVLQIDLGAKDAISALPEDVSVVFALAALNGTGRFYSQPNTVLVNSTLPTLTIIEKYIRIAPIIYSSSSEVYASTIELFEWNVPTDETVPVSIADVHNLRWSYATAKLFGEVALISAAAEFGGSGAIVRYHNVYGPDMGTDHFIPDFIERVKSGVKVLYGANQTRSFLYIDDAISGTVAAIQGVSNQVPIYHLGTSEELTIETAANVILSVMNTSREGMTKHDAPIGSVNRRCADAGKAKNELGWEASISFHEGISMILNGRRGPNNE